jgi:amino acid adenylation domain-containing protein
MDLPAELIGGLDEFARRHAIRTHSLYVTAHVLLLSVLSQGPSISVMVAVGAARQAPGSGLAVEGAPEVPLKVRIEPAVAKLQLARDVDAFLAPGYRAGSGAAIVPDDSPHRALWERSSFAYRPTGPGEPSTAGADPCGSRSPFHLNVLVGPERAVATVFYDRDCLGDDEIDQALAIYRSILGSLVLRASMPFSFADYLHEGELQGILYDFNRTQVHLNPNRLLHEPFEAIACREPERTAILFQEQAISYGDLNSQANRLAHLLLRRDPLAPDTTVAIVAERTPFAVVAMLAVLKAGAAYVPVDPRYPAERQAFIIANSSARIVVADRAYPHLEGLGIPLVASGDPELEAMSIENPATLGDPNHLAYVIYTSGSTGRPKGVMIEHRSIVNLVSCINRDYGVSSADRFILLSSLCFDLSVYDVFGALSAGAVLVIVGPEEVGDPFALASILQRQRVTLWNSVPSTLLLLTDHLVGRDRYICDSLRAVLLSGDWIPLKLPRALRPFFPRATVISLGGATEATVWSCHFKIDDIAPQWKSIPYGYPLANSFFYVLDERGQPVPRGVVGELHIGGIGVARGYINDAERTSSAFRTNPFTAELSGRLYRTGDLGRLTFEDHLEILGRKDDQVKLRGYRVELGEIEHALERHDHVLHAVAACRDIDGRGKELLAYVTMRLGREFDRRALREHLTKILPAYMVPVYYFAIAELPLGANGKVDRGRLPLPSQRRAADGPSGSDVEQLLRAIWRDVLGLDEFSSDSELADLGCNSFTAVQLIARIEKTFGVQISLSLLMNLASLTEVAHYVATHRHSPPPAAKDAAEAPEARSCGLTGLQMSYYLGETALFSLGSSTAHLYKEFTITKEASANLDRALNRLIAGHPMLRSYIEPPGRWRLLERVPEYHASVVDLTAAAADVANELELQRQRIREQGVETSRWPLFDFTLIRLDGPVNLLHCRLDLILVDGFSIGRLLEQLDRLLVEPDFGLDFAPWTYFDYRAAWERFTAEARYLEAKRYWMARLATLPDAPRLPTAASVENVRRSALTSHEFTIARDAFGCLKQRAAEFGVSPGMCVYAAFARVLARWGTSSSFAVNVLYYNREPLVPRVHDIVGNFSSTLLFETEVRNESFVGWVRLLQRRQIEELKHAVYDGVDVLNARNRLHRNANPAMPVVFTSLLGMAEPAAHGAIEETWMGVQTPHVSLDCLVRETAGKLAVLWSVQDDIFPPGLPDDMLWAFQQALERLAQDPACWDRPLSVALPVRQRETLAACQRIPRTPVESGPAGAPGVAEGEACRNQTFRVLDGELQDRPIDVPGDLYIVMTSAGPAHRNEATEPDERFVRDPHTGEWLFRTGSAGCFRWDGSLEQIAPLAERAAAAPVPAEVKTEHASALPTGEVECMLHRLWRELLNTTAIGVDDNFFDLGGHSLLAAQLISKVRAAGNIELPLSVVYERGTIREIARALAGRPGTGPTRNLLLLQPQGVETPFYCIHALGGHAAHYRVLADHMAASRRPFYGVQARGFERAEAPLRSIRRMAEIYLEQIEDIQRHGPYHLGGWSFGGLVAYEIARQLERRRNEIANVVMIDTRISAIRWARAQSDLDVFRSFVRDLERRTGTADLLPAAELAADRHARTRHLSERCRARGLLGAEHGVDAIDCLFGVYAANVAAMAEYQIEPLACRVVLIKARTQSGIGLDVIDADEPLGARAVLDPEVVEVDGDHYSILSAQHARGLAKAIAAVLRGRPFPRPGAILGVPAMAERPR